MRAFGLGFRGCEEIYGEKRVVKSPGRPYISSFQGMETWKL
jgi:hypothetical protein